MPEETASASATESVEEKPCSSSAPKGAPDVIEEAKKLIGTGNRHLVMGDVVSAVSVFQEACAMLAEKFGDTADECGEAFFLCGKSLLELARMENSVLGNALEGVPEESSEEGEKQNDSKIECADNLDDKTRGELREQVYDAMSEENRAKGAPKVDKEGQEVKEEVTKEQPSTDDTKEAPVQKEHEYAPVTKENMNQEKQPEHPTENEEKPSESGASEVEEKTSDNGAAEVAEEKTGSGVSEKAADNGTAEVAKEKVADNGVSEMAEEEAAENGEKNKAAEKAASKPEESVAEQDDQSVEQGATDEKDGATEEDARDEEEGEEGADEGDDDDEEEGNTENKENEEDVGNLQLAWEMLEVAKVIYKRKESIEDQLMAAQIFLKLGEVGAESGNYSQALEDFQECLAIQLKHLSAHSRLLAETHYQLGTTFSYTGQYSQAIQHFTSSIKVIESRLAMLQEAIDKAEGDEAAKDEKRELEELKQLLPEIAEKVEDAKESQRTAAAASEAIHQTLGGASTSSGFAAENGSTSTASQTSVKPTDGASSSKSASDISHLVRKKRKPEDESPKKDSEAKKVKQETTVNGSGDSASNSNGIQEKMEQEVVDPPTSEETSA